MGKLSEKRAAAKAARRSAALKVVCETFLPAKVMVTARVYDERTAQYRTMPVSAMTPVRSFEEFSRLWKQVTKLVEKDETWTS